MSTIKVKYTRDCQNKPLVDLDGGPFCMVTIRPQALRALAIELLRAAETAERRPTKGRWWAPYVETVDI